MRTKQTERNIKSTFGVAYFLLGEVVCLGALILICSSASAQNLFVSDGSNIYEVDPHGVRTTFASGVGGSLAFDSVGNLFVATSSNPNGGGGTIYKFTPDGIRTTFVSGLDFPGDMAFDRDGNLFVFDISRGSSVNEPVIYKFNPEGARTTLLSGIGLNTTTGLAFDSAGNLFISEYGSGVKGGTVNGVPKILKFTPSEVGSTFASPSELNGPLALAFDGGGNLFVSDDTVTDSSEEHTFPGAIYKFTRDGKRKTFAAGFTPFALAFDSAGNLFASDFHTGSILKFTPSGVRSTFVSGLSGSLAFPPPQTPTPTLVNVSVRGSVGTGEGPLINGFIITGSDSEQVIIRGLGPTLSSFGVADALQDPVLALHNINSTMTSNDNWQNAANVGQIPMNYRPADVRESAIMATLSPGAYTSVLSGKNATTGNALLEVYSNLPGLSNVSTRGFVGRGDDVLIGGFSCSGGNGSIQLIIRALGPTLIQFGVNGALADPTLMLVNSNGNVVASNDNWKNTQQSTIQAAGFAPPNDLESAIFAILPNGNYTAIVAGKNGGTGIGLLEVYKVALATNK